MVLSFLLKDYKFRAYFSFEDLYLHSLESSQFPLLLLLIQFWVQKQGGGCRESDFHAELALTDPILTFVDRCLIGVLNYIFRDI